MPNKPNILVFLPDGLQAAPLQPDHVCSTPNCDRVAAAGVRFDRAYTPSSTCSPARASLMTGLLPHNHGVLQVEHCVDADQCVLRTDKPHWAQSLERSGYKTGYFGKWNLERGFSLDEFGWLVNGSNRSEAFLQAQALKTRVAERQLDPDVKRIYSGPPGYTDNIHYGVTDILESDRKLTVPTDMATQFLEKALQAGEPWCCFVSMSEPNDAMICGRATFDRYDVEAIELPPNVDDDLSDRPNLYRRAQKIWSGVTPRQWREAMACYFSRITEVDRQLGRLLNQVDGAGKLEDTVVIVSSDHAKYVGAHGMDAHNFGAFEEIYNIPLIVSGPGIAKGETTQARVGLHDLCPTILELAGLEPFGDSDSRSFKAVLTDPGAARGDFNTGYAESFGSRYWFTQRILWQGRWKYVFNGFDFDELYDLENDPAETNNLCHRREHEDTVVGLMKVIWQRISETGDDTLRNTHYCAMRFAAIGPEWQTREDA